LAEPQAESPSTIYNSDFIGSLEEQSASLPGRVIHSNAPFLIIVSLAALAANLAFAAKKTFSIIFLAVDGSSSKNSINFSAKTESTAHLASEVPNLPFVCHSNCGSTTLIDTTQVSPSITSSLVRLLSFSFNIPLSLAYLLIVLVREALNHVRCVPHSGV